MENNGKFILTGVEHNEARLTIVTDVDSEVLTQLSKILKNSACALMIISENPKDIDSSKITAMLDKIHITNINVYSTKNVNELEDEIDNVIVRGHFTCMGKVIRTYSNIDLDACLEDFFNLSGPENSSIDLTYYVTYIVDNFLDTKDFLEKATNVLSRL